MAILKNVKVSFASLTSDTGFKNGKHLLGVVVDKAFKKQFKEDFNKVWEENKTAKAKKPAYDMEDWFSIDEETEEIIFWTNAKAGKERGIIFKQAKGQHFTSENFKTMGTGSMIDLEYDLYYFNSPTYGEMTLRSIKAVCLNEFVAYAGGSDLEGKSIDMDVASDTDDTPLEEEKHKKKKKKKKNKD